MKMSVVETQKSISVLSIGLKFFVQVYFGSLCRRWVQVSFGSLCRRWVQVSFGSLCRRWVQVSFGSLCRRWVQVSFESLCRRWSWGSHLNQGLRVWFQAVSQHMVVTTGSSWTIWLDNLHPPLRRACSFRCVVSWGGGASGCPGGTRCGDSSLRGFERVVRTQVELPLATTGWSNFRTSCERWPDAIIMLWRRKAMSVRSPNPGSTKAKNGTTGRAMSHPAQPTGVI